MINQELLSELTMAFQLETYSSHSTKTITNKPFVNQLNEFIACPKVNVYFLLADCKTRHDVEIKILKYLSRSCAKAEMPEHYKELIRRGCNAFLGTDFDEEEWLLIYEHLGNGVNHDLALDFIEYEYDIDLLKDITKED